MVRFRDYHESMGVHMMKLLSLLFAMLTALFGLSGNAFQPSMYSGDSDMVVTIRIAPSVLILDKDQGGDITVHVEIPYTQVIRDSVFLSGTPARVIFPDNRGNLVAKFDEICVKEKIDSGYVTLELRGEATDGNTFCGSEKVLAIYWRNPR